MQILAFGPSGGAQTRGLAVPNRALYPLSYTWMINLWQKKSF